MDTDIRDDLDRCFGDGPPVDDLDLLLSRGHTAVRRRRLAGATSTALLVGTVTAIALVSSGGTAPSTSPDPAGIPTENTYPQPVEEDPLLRRLVRPFWDYWAMQEGTSITVVRPDTLVAGEQGTFTAIVTDENGNPVDVTVRIRR